MADGESSITSQLTSYSGHSIFVWLPIIPAGTGFLPSAGERVVRESSKIVSLFALLAVINNKYRGLKPFYVLHHGSQTKTIFIGTVIEKRNSEGFF